VVLSAIFGLEMWVMARAAANELLSTRLLVWVP